MEKLFFQNRISVRNSAVMSRYPTPVAVCYTNKKGPSTFRFYKSRKAHNLGHLTDSLLEQSPSWKTNTSSAIQEIPLILWNSEVHYHTHNSQPPVPVMSQINSIHPPSHFLKIYFNIILPSTPRYFKCFLPRMFQLKPCMLL